MRPAIRIFLIMVGVLFILPTSSFAQSTFRTYDFGYGTITRGSSVTIIRRDPVRMYPYMYGRGGFGWGYTQPQIEVRPRARRTGPYQPTTRERGPLGKLANAVIGVPLKHAGDLVGGTLEAIGEGVEAIGGIERPSGPVVDLETGHRWCEPDDVECHGVRGQERGIYDRNVADADAAEEEGYRRTRESSPVVYRRPPSTFE